MTSDDNLSNFDSMDPNDIQRWIESVGSKNRQPRETSDMDYDAAFSDDRPEPVESVESLDRMSWLSDLAAPLSPDQSDIQPQADEDVLHAMEDDAESDDNDPLAWLEALSQDTSETFQGVEADDLTTINKIESENLVHTNPILDDNDPLSWLESLAKRQGADEEELITDADLEIPLIDSPEMEFTDEMDSVEYSVELEQEREEEIVSEIIDEESLQMKDPEDFLNQLTGYEGESTSEEPINHVEDEDQEEIILPQPVSSQPPAINYLQELPQVDPQDEPEPVASQQMNEFYADDDEEEIVDDFFADADDEEEFEDFMEDSLDADDTEEPPVFEQPKPVEPVIRSRYMQQEWLDDIEAQARYTPNEPEPAEEVLEEESTIPAWLLEEDDEGIEDFSDIQSIFEDVPEEEPEIEKIAEPASSAPVLPWLDEARITAQQEVIADWILESKPDGNEEIDSDMIVVPSSADEDYFSMGDESDEPESVYFMPKNPLPHDEITTIQYANDEPFMPLQAPLSDSAYDMEPQQVVGDDLSQLLNAARMKVRMGNIDGSLKDYEKLIQENFQLENITYDLQRISNAQVHYLNPVLHRILGDTFMRQGKLKEALNTYRKALNML